MEIGRASSHLLLIGVANLQNAGWNASCWVLIVGRTFHLFVIVGVANSRNTVSLFFSYCFDAVPFFLSCCCCWRLGCCWRRRAGDSRWVLMLLDASDLVCRRAVPAGAIYFLRPTVSCLFVIMTTFFVPNDGRLFTILACSARARYDVRSIRRSQYDGYRSRYCTCSVYWWRLIQCCNNL